EDAPAGDGEREPGTESRAHAAPRSLCPSDGPAHGHRVRGFVVERQRVGQEPELDEAAEVVPRVADTDGYAAAHEAGCGAEVYSISAERQQQGGVREV